jgi:phosphoserine phosphatase
MSDIEHAADAGPVCSRPASPPIDAHRVADGVAGASEFQVAGWSRYLGHTGGDFYDWQTLADGRILIAVGDVAGHGPGTEALAALCRAHLRACWQAEDRLEHIVARLNDLLSARLAGGRFVTATVGLLDPETNGMQLYLAGHGPVVYYRARARRFLHLSANHVPIGLFDLCPLDPGRCHALRFEPGDALVVLTDGFHEWMNRAGDAFGLRRIDEALDACAGAPPPAMIEELLAAVHGFAGGVAQHDDVTALVLRRDTLRPEPAAALRGACAGVAA